MQQMIALQHSLDEVMMQFTPPEPAPDARVGRRERRAATETAAAVVVAATAAATAVPQTPAPANGGEAGRSPEARLSRSFSSASRNPHRLSLTLPIAPPTPNPSRPAPSSAISLASVPSYPPTPSDTQSAVASPAAADPNDFITAIAAQERRVLELREELQRTEVELKRLKKQWSVHEAQKKRAERRNAEPLRPMSASAYQQHHAGVDLSDEDPHHRHTELDRRKAWLLSQQQQQQQLQQLQYQHQPAGERGKRRIFSGAHARTLSLLSPTRPSPSGFSVHEDASEGTEEGGSSSTTTISTQPLHSPRVALRYAPVTPALLAKRASWAPRSSHQSSASASASASGVRQITEDLKTGFWTFVEDLRQATVGEEPITGSRQYLRSIDANLGSGGGGANPAKPAAVADTSGQDTIRASRPRPTLAGVFDGTPTPASRFRDVASDAAPSTAAAAADSAATAAGAGAATKPKAKRFSWTPLTLDNFEDADWSSWDSPAVSSPRWSGTTVNGDIIPVPEKATDEDKALVSDENSAPPQSPSGSSHSASKLEDLIPPMLKELSPTNLKRHASEFMKEWERSLVDPATATAAESPELV